MKYGNRSLGKRIISSPLSLIAAFVLLVLIARATLSIHGKAVVSATKLSQAQAEFQKLQARQADLSNKVGYLSTDAGMEAEIRTKYRAVKNGESVAVIVDDSANTAAVAQASTTPPVGWFMRFLGLFGL